jgi:hypothetical protein
VAHTTAFMCMLAFLQIASAQESIRQENRPKVLMFAAIDAAHLANTSQYWGGGSWY